MIISLPIVDRLLDGIGEDRESFVEILSNYTAIGRSGDSLHVQALKCAKQENDEEQEMNALFVIEKVMQEVGIIGEDEVPTKAVDHRDPFAKRYTYHDLVLVLTLLTFGLVQNKVLKKPDTLRKPIGKNTKIKHKEEDVVRVQGLRENAEDRLVGVKELRSLYRVIEKRMLYDLDMFYVTMKANPADMVVLCESRIVMFEVWNDVKKKRPRIDMTEENQDSEEVRNARRKRIEAMMEEDDD